MVQSDRNEALELNLGADPFLPSMPRPLFFSPVPCSNRDFFWTTPLTDSVCCLIFSI